MFIKIALLCLSLLALSITVACGDDSDTLSIPGSLEAQTIHDRLAIQLYWPEANGAPDAIIIERSNTGRDGPWVKTATIAGEHTTYIDQEGLSNNVTYHYRVKARLGSNESSYSNVVSAIATSLPTPPPTR
ncbi:MAG: fibronectin type III domain-containing protein [SAR202 cluster bacterium]|nr:fibronectin type III domain-containing protein [SAR202 cluster bacterium]